MSQASNHIDWCLKKADKEIEECKKLGKKPKHRGLVKIKPDLNEAKKHLDKAIHNLNGISRFKDIGFSDWSISAGFYCIYHCFLAISLKFGYESSNQTCTVSLIRHLKEENKIDIDDKFINLIEEEVIDMREDYTYGIKISVKDEAKLNGLINNCKDMIDITKETIHK